MDRRTFMRNCGIAATITLAGCGGTRQTGDDGPTDENEPTDTSTPAGRTTEAVETTSGTQPQVVGQSVATDKTECGSPDESAAVTFDSDDGSVAIDGVMAASNPCYAATLSSVAYDDASNTLTVRVGVESTAQTCQECLGRVEYRASIGFIGGLPGRVIVEHGTEDPQTAADVTR